MANELQVTGPSGASVYYLIRSATGLIWDGATLSTYQTINYANYKVPAFEQGSASGFYTATFPSSLVAGVYSIVAKVQAGGSPVESDQTLGEGNFQWNGTTTAALADAVTSGQFSQLAPIRLARGTQILKWPFKLVSSLDHITPLTSGVVSGQISRDGGNFGPLQSGAYIETGLGWYSLQALTSGDLLANTIALTFSANGISGGSSDPRDFSMVLQRVSGVS